MSPTTGSVEQIPIQLRRILFATDFSPVSAMALPYAAAFARHFGADLSVAHVVAPDEYAHVDAKHREAVLARMEQAAAERIAETVSASRYSDLHFRARVDHGDVTAKLARLAQQDEIDLIVTGSHGRHGLRKLFSAPVDEGIARTACCPVLLVGPEVDALHATDARVERILLPIFFHPQSRRALHCAFGLAHSFGASLDLLHVAEDVWKEPLATRVTPEAFCRARMLDNGLPQSEFGVEPRFHVEFGPAEETILEFARALEMQLIVVGVPASIHPRLLSHLPGPLAYDVASHAACPVLAVCQPKEGKNHAAPSTAPVSQA